MSNLNVRAHIRLTSQEEVQAFIHGLSDHEDAFSIESRCGKHRVNAKSIIGVLYTMFDFPEEMYLTNDTHAGEIPACVDRYRVQK